MDILVLSSLYAGPIIILALLYFAFRRNANNIFLAASLFCIWYSLAITKIIISREILNFPYLIRTGNIGAYLIYPLLYIYVRNTFYPGKYWKKTDWLLLLPAFIYVIDMWPFFFSSAQYKIEVFSESISKVKKLFKVSEGWIAIPGFHFILRYVFSFFVFVAISRLIIINRKNQPLKGTTVNRSPYIFMIALAILYIPSLFPGIFGVILHAEWYTLEFLIITLAVTLIGVLIFLLVSPDVLYGYLKGDPITGIKDYSLVTLAGENLNESEAVNETGLFQKELKFSEVKVTQEAEVFLNSIEEIFRERKPFRQPGYSIHDLSVDTGIPVYQLSLLINRVLGTNFNNWVNQYRVDYFLSLIQREDFDNLTQEAVAREAGFTNKVTFYNAFKRVKGVTPGSYLKSRRG
jgi:AraC-like DNA-binding protein